MRFEFGTAARIVFGPGTIAELPAIARKYGLRAMVVTGRDKMRRAGTIADLEGAGFTCTLFGVSGEPSVDLIREGAAALRAGACNVVIAIGGGSAIDAGKAIAAMGSNPGDVLDYLEVVGRGLPLEHDSIPFIAIPTTAGTGSEVTRNAVLASPAHAVKASLRGAGMLPRVAIVDPELTLGLPRELTAATGLDAVTQLIEPYVSIRANPLTDALCRDGLRMAVRCLPRVCANGRDAEARAGMSCASLYGGLALANAGLGVVHGFAAPIGGMFDAPHGAVCAAILEHGMRANIRALAQRAPESDAGMRYTEIARILTGRAEAVAEDGAAWMGALVQSLGVPGLRRYGIDAIHIEGLAEKAARASSMKGNPIQLTPHELTGILTAAL